MPDESDVWNTTFYHRAVRKNFGDALWPKYDLSQPLPDTIRTLLNRLDEPSEPGPQIRRNEPPENTG
jgi:hypothetical protein